MSTQSCGVCVDVNSRANESRNVQERLDSYLDAIESAVRDGGEFVKEQAPLVLQELLAWEFWSSIMVCIVLMALICVIHRMRHFVVAQILVSDMHADDKKFFIAFYPIVAATISLAFAWTAYHYGMQAVKVKIAPRLVVIEEVKRLSSRGGS